MPHLRFILVFSALLLQALPAMADVAPTPGGLTFEPPGSPVQRDAIDFHDRLLMPVITAISLFVLGLLGWVIVRYNAKRNPTPSKTSHNTLLEIIWTAIPALILVVIGIPSIKLLYYGDTTEKADLTVKAVGHQWYWSYEYPDHGDIAFDSYMIQEKDLQPGQPRNLAVDNRMVVPVNKNIRILITSDDVLHSWGVTSLGVKRDAVPGRLNETWTRIEKEGIYYGECYEICGPNHAFMPVAVEAVSEERFAAWVKEKGGQMPGVGEKPASTTPVPNPVPGNTPPVAPVPATPK